MICATFNALVYALGGLTVAVHPARQIVVARLSWVTFGLIEPGVSVGFGRPTDVLVEIVLGIEEADGVDAVAVGRLARGPGSQLIARRARTSPRTTPPKAAQMVLDTA
jgi:queuine/archaeosine tRNA-ribosyltransferase